MWNYCLFQLGNAVQGTTCLIFFFIMQLTDELKVGFDETVKKQWLMGNVIHGTTFKPFLELHIPSPQY